MLPLLAVRAKTPELGTVTLPFVTVSTSDDHVIEDLFVIFEFKANEDGSLYLFVDASSSGNIKPITVIEAYLSMYYETLQENALMITREDTYTNIAKPGKKPRFVPLDDIGSTIE